MAIRLTGTVVAYITIGMLLVIGAIILGYLKSLAPSLVTDTEGQQLVSNITTTVSSQYSTLGNLSIFVIMITVLVGVLAVLLGAFRGAQE